MPPGWNNNAQGTQTSPVFATRITTHQQGPQANQMGIIRENIDPASASTGRQSRILAQQQGGFQSSQNPLGSTNGITRDDLLEVVQNSNRATANVLAQHLGSFLSPMSQNFVEMLELMRANSKPNRNSITGQGNNPIQNNTLSRDGISQLSNQIGNPNANAIQLIGNNFTPGGIASQSQFAIGQNLNQAGEGFNASLNQAQGPLVGQNSRQNNGIANTPIANQNVGAANNQIPYQIMGFNGNLNSGQTLGLTNDLGFGQNTGNACNLNSSFNNGFNTGVNLGQNTNLNPGFNNGGAFDLFANNPNLNRTGGQGPLQFAHNNAGNQPFDIFQNNFQQGMLHPNPNPNNQMYYQDYNQ